MAARPASLFLSAAAAALLALPAAAQQASMANAETVRDRAMAGDDIAYDWVKELTTRFGPRPAGTHNEEAAARWSADRLKALGFENVAIQPFPVTAWIRGPEKVELLGPEPQTLAAASLGETPATPPGGVEGEVVTFATLEDLMAVPDGSLKGKIVYVNRPMTLAQDGAGYGPISRIRVTGPNIAAHKGAVAFLLRSAGTDHSRYPHTGTTAYENGKVLIPAFALSVVDAEQLDRIQKLGGPAHIRVTSSARYVEGAHSQNVIAEIKGREHPEQVVLIGAHLDSWDLGTGAIDDGTGDAIVVAAAKLIHDLPQHPRRTIRVVLYGSEEIGQPSAPGDGRGGHAYADSVKGQIANHVMAAESDFGADRIYRVVLPKGSTASPFGQQALRLMAPISVLVQDGETDGGEDVGKTIELGVPAVDLNQDGTRYFDIHHTAYDVLDAVDKQQLDQNVAAWAGLIWLIADSDVDFRALGKAGKP